MKILYSSMFFSSTAVNGCQRGSSCLRWNHCQIRKGKFAGMCQDDTFHVCCYLEDNEVDEDDDLLVPEVGDG